jgi:acetyltransferase-like isoleucine patch superfamily enzyme
MNKSIELQVSDELIQAFSQNRIFFSNNPNQKRSFHGGIIKIPAGVQLRPYTSFNAGNILASLDVFSYTNSELSSLIKAGRYCSIANGVKVMGYRHPYERISSSAFTYDRSFSLHKLAAEDAGIVFPAIPSPSRKERITIGNDVWVGAEVLIARGVTIGDGAVIAARSVVTKDVPPCAIVAGVPAKVVRYRFSPELCERYLQSGWWNYKFTDFADMPFDRPGDFLDALQEKVETGVISQWHPADIDIERFVELAGTATYERKI